MEIVAGNTPLAIQNILVAKICRTKESIEVRSGLQQLSPSHNTMSQLLLHSMQWNCSHFKSLREGDARGASALVPLGGHDLVVVRSKTLQKSNN